ncbi:hypothetical protein AXE65_09620 [Ventosimonas gracilis]|uniref:Uncharacterized protein n=1 Tax=Ventosimonas gracilis TaxID=1680762 RepID=A0A139SX97_9GAMM|nr:hypothetical protein AXE65_09620 [Ventosimonas gracilis]
MPQRKSKKYSQFKIIDQSPASTALLGSLKIAPRGDLGSLPTTNPHTPPKKRKITALLPD